MCAFLYPGEYLDSTYEIDFDKLYKDINNLLSNNDEYKTMKENLNKLNKVKSSKIIYDEIKRILK